MKNIALVIDIDGTMIGNVATQRMLFAMAKDKFNVGKIPMRPHFIKFVKTHPDAELFIYTASVSDWAEFLISHIESKYDIKFNRPLFSRESSIWSGTRSQ